MGCSSSVVSPDGENEITSSTKENSPLHKSKLDHEHHQNGHVKAKAALVNQNNALRSKPDVDKNANNLKVIAPQAPVPKSVAFDVSLDGNNDVLLAKKRPPRLQALEPLSFPTLTAEQLQEKQRLADEKRERMKQKKISTSQKSSKRRRELMKAREFGSKQQMELEKTEIEDSMKQAQLKRDQRLLEIKEKQKIREERAKRIRERAKRLQNPDEEVEVEKDEEFNAASDDSWLGNQDNTEADDEIVKPVRSLRPTISASTVDSYDAAFMRQKSDVKQSLEVQPFHQKHAVKEVNDDDFFGS